MKKIYIFFLAFVQVLCWVETEAQTLEYNFQRPDTLFGELPFDRTFTIKFTHIDTGRVDAIVVRIYETGITNYRSIVKAARPPGVIHRKGYGVTAAVNLTNNLYLAQPGTIVITPDTIIKYRNFSDSTAFMQSLITLKPSAGYFIEISTHEKVPVSKAEAEYFSREIRADPQIKKSLTTLRRNIFRIHERQSMMQIRYLIALILPLPALLKEPALRIIYHPSM